MRAIAATLLAVSCLTGSLAQAADKTLTPQQEKMKAGSAQAGDRSSKAAPGRRS
jgi:hypothetical protein